MGLIISDYLSKLEFGELKIFNRMGVIPLFASINETPQYLTLKEALEKRFLTITEVSQGGSVPELKVVNRCYFDIVRQSLVGDSNIEEFGIKLKPVL
jgi:hypothetical protein